MLGRFSPGVPYWPSVASTDRDKKTSKIGDDAHMEGFDIERLEERRDDALGVIYRKERWVLHTDRHHPVTMESGYSPDGGYIGTWEDTQKLVSRGIYPERRSPSDATCSIGFCPREGKWYGWSHRAIYGFGGFAQKPLVSPSLLCRSRFCTKSDHMISITKICFFSLCVVFLRSQAWVLPILNLGIFFSIYSLIFMG